MRTRSRKKWLLIVPAAIAGMLLLVFVGGEVVMRLWNWLLPPLFGFREVTFWQAVGLLALCRILFGNVGGRGRGFDRSGMRQRIAERGMARMTPEERERFVQGMRGRCGFEPPAGDTANP